MSSNKAHQEDDASSSSSLTLSEEEYVQRGVETTTAAAAEALSTSLQQLGMMKICTIGDSGVGKTSIIESFVQGGDYVFGNTKATIGADFKVKQYELRNGSGVVRVHLWDTNGNERFAPLQGTYYRGSNGVVAVFDVTRLDTLRNLDKWMEHFRQYTDAQGNVPVLVIANKEDEGQRLPAFHQQILSQALTWCERNGNWSLCSSSVKTRPDALWQALSAFIEEVYYHMNPEHEASRVKIHAAAVARARQLSLPPSVAINVSTSSSSSSEPRARSGSSLRRTNSQTNGAFGQSAQQVTATAATATANAVQQSSDSSVTDVVLENTQSGTRVKPGERMVRRASLRLNNPQYYNAKPEQTTPPAAAAAAAPQPVQVISSLNTRGAIVLSASSRQRDVLSSSSSSSMSSCCT